MGITRHKVQVAVYFPRAVAKALRERAKARHQTVTEYVYQLVSEDLDGQADYMRVQAGHQLTRANALLSAIASKLLPTEDVQAIKAGSSAAAKRAYGPVPMRPFEIETRLVLDEQSSGLADPD